MFEEIDKLRKEDKVELYFGWLGEHYKKLEKALEQIVRMCPSDEQWPARDALAKAKENENQ